MQAVVQLNAPPNTPVFTLQARDPDTDHSIHYFIVRDRSKLFALVSLHSYTQKPGSSILQLQTISTRYLISRNV